jgi:glyoxylase-like metal-dependent hydrolase (beta-lactamase superfamily II)
MTGGFQLNGAEGGDPGTETVFGEFRVRVIRDARIQLPVADLNGIDLKLASQLIGGGDSAWTPVNAYLVRTPEHTVLVDTGAGKHPEEDSGHLMEGLKSAGVQAAKIDLILITHFHFDHIGGLTSPEGKRMFPYAVVRVPEAEHAFWMQDPKSIPVFMRERAQKIRAIFAPYIAAKAYLPFGPKDVLGPGIMAMPAPGHTPGHSTYSFTSKGTELWCIGDLIHFGAIQFNRPSVGVRYDIDAVDAVAARLRCFERAVSSKCLLAGTHLPVPVRLIKRGDGFAIE